MLVTEVEFKKNHDSNKIANFTERIMKIDIFSSWGPIETQNHTIFSISILIQNRHARARTHTMTVSESVWCTQHTDTS